MRDADGTVLVFNGEIYNVASVRRELEATHAFVGSSDTEVVLQAWRRWGAAALDRLRGMFAFAIWEPSSDRLTLVRDRLGIKPLYFHRSGSRLVFGSEIRTLLASGLVPAEPDHDAVSQFLSMGSPQEPLTAIRGVHMLEPGSLMTWHAGQSATRSYWSLLDAFESARAPSTSLRGLLEESVRLHLVSDVPTSVFLSGGIDSTVLVGLAAAEQPRELRTLSVTFPEAELSEAPFIDLARARHATDHQDVRLGSQELLGSVTAAVDAMDQPTIDGVNTYVVSRAAREAGLTVALSGLGGDELFAGYPTFRDTHRLLTLGRAGRPLAWPLAAWNRRFPPTERRAKLLRWLRAGDRRSVFAAYQLQRELLEPADVGRLMMAPPTPLVGPRLPHDELNAVSYLELTGFMRNQLLRDADVMSMANSVELRVPFLDHLLVEAMAATPGEEKVRRGTPKPLLVDAATGLLPEALVHRRKMGFTLPFEHWLRGELRQDVEAVLTDAEGMLDRDARIEVWQRFLDGRTNWARPWGIYVLERWRAQLPKAGSPQTALRGRL